MLYWIGYDLDKPGQNYDAVISTLERLGAVRVLLSDWLLESTTPCNQIHDIVRAKMDPNDRLIVSEVNFNAVWSNLLADKDAVLALYNRAARRC